ncbi:hypothetical protein D9757_000798 [Collybiopsis confluens]|uniref:Uncharacterized protein n=1 Tax=Collybiopsis confluens TaxID=2823264 RepID=A0A8H5I0G5_9AGAR|nr:hypothetical protein D9757_000798 [Collybiopsis confluens]
MAVNIDDKTASAFQADAVQLMDPDATTLRSLPKLKPLIIPEQGSVAIGLLTPVDEAPDNAEYTTNETGLRPLPTPKSDPTIRLRASSWATWSADASSSQTSTRSPSRWNTSAAAPRSRAAKGDSDVGSSVESSQRRSPARTRTRDSRSATVCCHPETNLALKPTLKSSHHRSSLPSPPERHFLSRGRASTQASPAVPKYHVQDWLASPTAPPLIAEPKRKGLGFKVKALPNIPISVNMETPEQDRQESKPRLTAKDKGKTKAIDVTPVLDTSNYGLLTPPDSAQSGPDPNTSSLPSGLRGLRPRGPRTRRSTIC